MNRPTRDHEIEELFAPVDVRAYASPVTEDLIDELRGEEAVAIGPMVAARRAEFATARACARAAMREFGVDAAVPRQASGAPLWPTQVAGSISHTQGFCIAVASTGSHSVGIDVEEIGRVKQAVERRILVDEERVGLDQLDDQDRQQHVATIFAAKEAFYKAHYEVDARYLGFDAVAVNVNSGIVTYSPSSGDVERELLDRTTGKVRVENGRVIVAVVIATTA